MAAALCAGLGALALAAPVASAQEQRDCFWAVAEDRALTENFNWTDSGGRYYLAVVTIPPGAEVVLRGEFPHSRYMSYTSNDHQAKPVFALADRSVVPNPGHTNPFVTGARRDATQRSYEARMVPGPPPEGDPEPNTIYMGGPDGFGIVLYRLYLPDRGTDEAGGVPLPTATLKLADGTELDEAATCEVLNTSAPQDLNDVYEAIQIPSWPPTPPSQDPIVWERFFNAQYLVAGQTETTPAQVVRPYVPADASGGSLSALDIAYASARPHRGFGPVLVLHGRAPTAPKTLDGQPVLGSGQVRYWSICQNELRRRSIACMNDEDVILDGNGWFTTVVSQAEDRPANARAECGVNWLNWGPNPDSLLILRHLLPEDSFTNSLAYVDEPGKEQEVVGDYLPTGAHMSKEAFEARGCVLIDLPRHCAALRRGTPAHDRLTGTAGSERIRGLRGRDTILAGAGDDCVNGGGWADRLFGQLGDDRLWGSGGPDRLYGGPGDDILKGGRGRDRLQGGPGNDVLMGRKGPDVLIGGPGRDVIRCQRKDRVIDPRGEDKLIGGCRR